MPDSSDNYQLPSWPPTLINRDLWNAVMGSIGDRLTAREELEADFEALIAQGTQASLDYIQATVAPQIATIQASIELAQQQIDQIVVDGIAPNAAKLGGQVPAYYATSASVTALGTSKADVSYVDTELLDLANAIQLLLDQKAGASAMALALDKRVRVDTTQTFTLAERGRARANIGGGVLAGHRNKLINGDFDIWQRQTAQTSIGYGSDDRWNNGHFNSPKNHSRQAFAPGQTDVPGNPKFFSRTIVNSVANAANFVNKAQLIEGVHTLAGRRVTLTFFAKADAAKSIAIDFAQLFGTGGSPSSAVLGIGARKVALTTAWQRFSLIFDIPGIGGKTFGTNGDDALGLTIWFEAGANFNARTDSLGQQSGTFDIAHVSLVEGDATAEDDPFAARHPQQELALCQRYFQDWTSANLVLSSNANSANMNNRPHPVPMRSTPSVIQTTSGSGAAWISSGRFMQQSGVHSADAVTAPLRFDAEL